MQLLTQWRLQLENLRRQGYDGGAFMASKMNSVQAIIFRSRRYSIALYVHCPCHCLNLTLSCSSTISSIRRCMKRIRECISFLRAGPKRKAELRNSIDVTFPEHYLTILITLCIVKWVERHDAVICFVQLFLAIVRRSHLLENDQDQDQILHSLQMKLCT